MTPSLVIAEIPVGVFVAVGVAFFLLVLLLVAGALTRRTTEGTGTGRLARETIKKDVGAPGALGADAGRLPGKEIEAIADLERRGGAVATVDPGDIAPYVPPDPETLGVTRRQFFNRSIIAFFILGLSGFGAAVIAFLWPQPKGGFGSKIRVGKISDIQAQIAANKGFYYVPEGRMWVSSYPASALEKAQKVYPPAVLTGLEAGVMALYQKCPHLGCRVPSCPTSQWFECPCHGSQFNQAGEKKGGPAPRGMDSFTMEVSDNVLTVDTGKVIQGPPIGTNTTGQEAEGPHCVGGGASH
jgi:cytochrome b6-f complex iron-sulfur subunit